MKTKKYILSTCGISLLSNRFDNNSGHRDLIFTHANAKERVDVPEKDRMVLEHIIQQKKNLLNGADIPTSAGMSAEINGIMRIFEDTPSQHGDFHQLLSTDTWLGATTAEMVQTWLMNHFDGISVDILRHQDLQTADMLSFQLSLSDLIRKLSKQIPDYADSGYRVIFNLTGGFKSIQGFLQSIANFYADETVYIFETSNQLMRIPRLPVRMDAVAAVEENITVLRNMAVGITHGDLSTVPEIFLFQMDGEVMFSPWGELIWDQARKEIYPGRLFPSPRPDKIHYSVKFKKDVGELSQDRIELVNLRIDQFNRYLDDESKNPSSLDFKRFKGKSMLPSTHEMDAWADLDARRIFGHFEGGRFVLDRLSKGVH